MREEQQRVVFAGLGVLAVEEAVGRQDGEHADADHQHAEESGESIDHQHAAEGRAILRAGVDCRAQGGGQSQQAEVAEEVRGTLVEHRVEHHQQGAEDGE